MISRHATNIVDASSANEVKNSNSVLIEQRSGRAVLRIYECPNPISEKFFGRIPHGPQETLIPLRSWLQNCDDEHRCMRRDHESALPTRLINVNASQNAEDLRLYIPKQGEKHRYLALSHCWGQSGKGAGLPPWCTSIENFDSRQNGFKLVDLPETFRDAVHVTRELGISYLWIDSVCIIQNQNSDWDAESRKMDQVFASAYCTIAATAAFDSRSGLGKGSPPHESLYIRDASEQCFYVSTNVADFDKDVGSAVLNQRAWVMQERLLSPRTIHFTNTELYGECGEGIYAGENIFIKSQYKTTKYYVIDPQFPDRLRSSGMIATWEFLQSLIEDYSRRGITKPSDRAVAISGLMRRISEALPDPVYYGVIEWYKHRGLLWQRRSGQETELIDYSPQPRVPSWSWMAYEGAIKFPPTRYGELDVIRTLDIDTQSVRTTVWKVVSLDLVAEGNENLLYDLRNSNGEKRGSLRFDREHGVTVVPHAAVLAKYRSHSEDRLDYLVVFVTPRASHTGYERVGMGGLHRLCALEEVGICEIS
ncbi:heterokaryon incompatibility protein-domain-containing protein [Xylariaceae sp. FL0255]|nr:heterokaryon incompatibility protein-domain-containing protein [Xylariaceae sp. FL0255]